MHVLKQSIKNISDNCYKIDNEIINIKKNMEKIDKQNEKLITELKQMTEDENTLKLSIIEK